MFEKRLAEQDVIWPAGNGMFHPLEGLDDL